MNGAIAFPQNPVTAVTYFCWNGKQTSPLNAKIPDMVGDFIYFTMIFVACCCEPARTRSM